jgi:hypothetical protein
MVPPLVGVSYNLEYAMKNLAGNKAADETVLEELYLANIPAVKTEQSTGEVPYTFVGKIGKWTFTRAWYYWVAKVEEGAKGMPLTKAMELHNKKHPLSDFILGKVVRSGGHCGCPSPDDYGAQPVYDDTLEKQLEAIGYKKEYCDFLKKEFISISVGEVSKLCNDGKLTVDRYVDCYHIDDQVGLVEFAKFLNSAVG